jgi:hypothetical protein
MPDLSGLHGRADWKAAIWAGLIAGLVFLMVEMLLVWLVMGMSPWAPPRMMAAMVLGPEILPPPADFSLMAVMTAMVIHFPLSIVYGLILGWAVHRLEMGAALLAGAAFGLVAVFAVNFHLIAPMAFPWFVEAQNWISVLAHVLFGVVLAGSYVAMRRT